MSRGERLRLQDILEAIAAVREYAPAASEPLSGAVRDAILFNLVVIGEAAAHISQETRDRTPQIPWKQVVGLRNLIAHEYFRIDPEIIGTIVHEQLDPLETAIRALPTDDEV